MDCVEEAKAASKKDDCPTLKRISRARVESADEPLFQTLRSSGLAMDLPMSQLELDTDFKYPVFPPREQLESLGSKGFLHKVLGIPIAYADTELPRFWKKSKIFSRSMTYLPEIIHQTTAISSRIIFMETVAGPTKRIPS